tara:strand:+ start:776 stop:1339 length:564 start_codon:yes stop_codon:yes gene_type:complete
MNDWTPEAVSRMPLTYIQQITSSLFNNTNFIGLLKRYHQSGDVRFYVTSYGSQPVIEAFLRRLGLTYLFNRVYTPSSFGEIDGYNCYSPLRGKNVMLERIAERDNLAPSQILLLDDSNPNVKYARKEGYKAIAVNPATGLVPRDGLIIEKFLGETIANSITFPNKIITKTINPINYQLNYKVKYNYI